MTVFIKGGQRWGEVTVPASKSQAHRALILSALGKTPVELYCRGLSRDIKATVDCLNSLGARITADGDKISVIPLPRPFLGGGRVSLSCAESGSTLRFLLPVAGMLGVNAEFLPKGRLYERPISPLDGVLSEHGAEAVREDGRIRLSGRLRPGDYRISGEVSSQYISGLLMALPFMDGDSSLEITGKTESAGYIRMTEDMLRLCGIAFEKSGRRYFIPGGQTSRPESGMAIEGDYSSASFFLCMGALSDRGITVRGLLKDSSQGDRQLLEILKEFGAEVEIKEDGAVAVRKRELRGITLDAGQIPDIIPPIAALSSVACGRTVIKNASRLRIKESDRLSTTAGLLGSLGARIQELDDGLIIDGVKSLAGGTASSCGDHRIAMTAALASLACDGGITLLGAEDVNKSYPEFWRDFSGLSEG